MLIERAALGSHTLVSGGPANALVTLMRERDSFSRAITRAGRRPFSFATEPTAVFAPARGGSAA